MIQTGVMSTGCRRAARRRRSFTGRAIYPGGGAVMAGNVEQRMRELGIELPQPSKPGANYVPFVRTGNLVVLTGQLSQWNGERRFVGKLGRDFAVAEGQQAARLCALNLIAHLRAALD